MPKRLELTGRKYDALYVDHFVEFRNGKGLWSCTCDCGNKDVIAIGSELVSGKKISCPECGKKRQTASKIKHGISHLPEYEALLHAIARCTKEDHPEWHNYGERGIRVCQEWIDDPKAFYDHIGPRTSPEHSLDRINNDGHYEPGNVKWSTIEEQNNNKRECKQITKDGLTLTPAQWARRLGMSAAAIHNRIAQNWPEDKLLDPPMTKQEVGKRSAEVRSTKKSDPLPPETPPCD